MSRCAGCACGGKVTWGRRGGAGRGERGGVSTEVLMGIFLISTDVFTSDPLSPYSPFRSPLPALGHLVPTRTLCVPACVMVRRLGGAARPVRAKCTCRSVKSVSKGSLRRRRVLFPEFLCTRPWSRPATSIAALTPRAAVRQSKRRRKRPTWWPTARETNRRDA